MAYVSQLEFCSVCGPCEGLRRSSHRPTQSVVLLWWHNRHSCHNVLKCTHTMINLMTSVDHTWWCAVGNVFSPVGVYCWRTGTTEGREHSPTQVPPSLSQLPYPLQPRRKWLPHLLRGQEVTGPTGWCRPYMVWKKRGDFLCPGLQKYQPRSQTELRVSLSFRLSAFKKLSLSHRLNLWCLFWVWRVHLCLRLLLSWRTITLG